MIHIGRILLVALLVMSCKRVIIQKKNKIDNFFRNAIGTCICKKKVVSLQRIMHIRIK